jgi:hypothetical protein
VQALIGYGQYSGANAREVSAGCEEMVSMTFHSY